ncbi:hypothetical protein [Ramlibacter alkalitolerans]|uniref:ATP-binding protein n=1 Tax=Ramlibacter alkalitolerans TaxID=2039631 RepID=A0ABS1JMH0_9BURK|nr:hypothetical protein [Ramlibacter alkalitolerans]MBL0425409.1 hypothetical protein [Ramlibacter alkalitolerans]
MSTPEYLDLQRTFIEIDPADTEEHDVSGEGRIGWREVLARRASVIRAPANFGKTTEMVEQARRMREQGQHAIFVALRRVRSRGGFEAAVSDTGDDYESFKDWQAATTSPMTVFLDSLDEASPGNDDDLTYWLRQVTAAVNWPANDVRWVISTRPALLTAKVVSDLQRLFGRGKTVTPASTASDQTSPNDAAMDAVFRERVTDPEALAVFRMTELDRNQSIRYLSERLGIDRAPELIALASRRGLGTLVENPGGLATLAEIDLLTRPPESLTEIFERLESSIARKLAADRRIKDAGNEGVELVTESVRRLAAASQLCQLPNIELPQEGLLPSADAISARLIVGSRISEAVLQVLLGAHGFSDVGHHQVKIFPNELPPYLAACHLSGLAKSPELAYRLVAALSWQAPTGESGVDRRLLPVMGWLATLNPHCRAEILKIDPQALAFFGDLRNRSVAPPDAERALRDSVSAIARSNDWPGRGQFRLTSEHYWQAGSTRTLSVILELFHEHGGSNVARDVLLDIAAYSGSDVLRDLVMSSHRGDYHSLLRSTMDADYILELGREEDLEGLAGALLLSAHTPESFASRVVATLGWTYLNARDVVIVLGRYLERGRSAFHLTGDVKEVLVPAASDQQLYWLVRGLVMKASQVRGRQGRRNPSTHMTNERFVEFSAELLAILLRRQHAPTADKLAILCLILFRAIRDAHHGSADVRELKGALKERADVRQAYFAMLVRWAAGTKGDLWQLVYGYGSICVPTDDDVSTLGSEPLRRLVREETARIERMAGQAPRTPQPKDRLQLADTAKAALQASIEAIRSGAALNEFAWLAGWLLHTTRRSRYGEVDFKQLEDRAGHAMAGAVREGLGHFWRSQPPRFKEDEPNSTYHLTAAGLQALHLELGEGKNLPPLSENEVRQAIRYAAFEINGFPKWFWALVRAHEDIAGDELEGLAKAASAGAVSREHAGNLFSALDQAPERIRERLAPLAWQILEGEESDRRGFIVDKMLTATAVAPDAASQTEFEALAWKRVSEPFMGAAAASPQDHATRAEAVSQATVWGSHWLRRHPRSFVERMQGWTAEDAGAAKAFVYALAMELGRDRGALLSGIATETHDGVDALGALYVIALDVVRPTDDAQHADGEVYAIGGRESAQDFRDAFVPAIAEARTQRAYDVLEWLKLKLGDKQRPYFRRVQYHMREAQFARPPLDQRAFEKFERDFEAGITGRVSFDLAVQNALVAVKYDIEHGEHSLRRFFSAVELRALKTDKSGLALESDFQQLLASELKHHARGEFVVQREPETAEHNRRDVHCAKESLDLTASIELKMSERWTLPEYFEALEQQLVGQYMRQRNANTGFLVIVLQRKRTWRCPGTRRALSFDDLVKALQSRADALMRDDSSKFLRVIGINAIQPKNFREARAKRVPSGAASGTRARRASRAKKIGNAKTRAS